MNSNHLNLWAGRVPVAKQTYLVCLWMLAAAFWGFFERTLYQEKLLAWNRNSLKHILMGQNIVPLLKTSCTSQQGKSEISFTSFPYIQFLIYNDVSSFSGDHPLKLLSMNLFIMDWWHYHSAISLLIGIHQEAHCLWHLPMVIRKEMPGYLKCVTFW